MWRLCWLSLLLLLLETGVFGDATEGDDNWVPNDGDIDVVEGVDGNYHVIEEEDVIVLTRETFTHVVFPADVIMVEMYAPWCGHCKSLAPKYSKAAKILKKEGIRLAKVDATKEAELAKEYMVTGYPTLIIFRKGVKVEEYSGPRETDDIVEYMRKQADPDWKPPPSAVLVLTSENFTKTVKESDLILVEWYAPWCKHCKQLEPEYEAAAKVLKQEYNIPLAKMDGPREKEIADGYNIIGWPALKIFRNGRVYDYKGPREKEGIIDFMKEQAKSPSKEVLYWTEAQNSLSRLEATVFGFFKSKTDLYDEYIVAANEMRGQFNFVHTFKPEIAEKFQIKQETIVVFQPEIFHSEYEDKLYKFSKVSGTYKEIMEFVRQSSIPLVGHRTKQNAAVKYASRPLVVIYFDVNYSFQYVKDTQFIRKKILKVAKDYKHASLTFAISNEVEFEDELKGLGLDDSGEDVNVAMFSEKQKFRMEPVDEFDTEDLRDFVQAVSAGKVPPYMKSQPIPKENPGPVKVVVANNFQQEVMEVKKDVLLEFYAPWCGHCKKLEPIYKKLAKKMLKENENLVVAKMDATANDIPPQFSVQGFPHIFFIPVYEKNDPIPFTSGERSYKNLKEFINQHSSIFLTEEERTGVKKKEDDEKQTEESEEQTETESAASKDEL